MSRVIGVLVFIVYIVVGLYLLLVPFEVFAFPDNLMFLEQWIFFIGGILVLFSGLRYIFGPSRTTKHHRER